MKNNDTLNIRRAQRRDIKTIVSFNLAMALETEDLQLNESTLALGVEQVMNDPAKGFYLVVEENDLVIASLMITREWSDWRNSWWWWIQSVYVDPEHRRRGIFLRMYDHVQRLAEKEAAAGLRLYVETSNVPARRTYVRCGMEESHYIMYEQALSAD